MYVIKTRPKIFVFWTQKRLKNSDEETVFQTTKIFFKSEKFIRIPQAAVFSSVMLGVF